MKIIKLFLDSIYFNKSLHKFIFFFFFIQEAKFIPILIIKKKKKKIYARIIQKIY
jgi:hypothetical protein